MSGLFPKTPDTKTTSKTTSRRSAFRAWMMRLGGVGHPVVLSAIATGAVVLLGRSLGLLQGLELGAYDHLVRVRPTPPPDERFLVVGITETDIQIRGEWPIQDQTVAEVLTTLLAAEPAAIGLDLFRDVPIGEEQAALYEVLGDRDQAIPVFSVCKISSADNPGVPPPATVPPERISFSDLLVDRGGILRRSLLAASPPPDAPAGLAHPCNTPDTQLFSLGFQLALTYLSRQGVVPTVTERGEIQLGDVTLRRLGRNLGGYRAVDDAGYQIMLNYRAARESMPQVSLTEVLSGQVSADQIRDRIVLIGATTPEAKDTFYTPFSGGLDDSQKMPGVVVHGQSASQVISAVLNDRPLIWAWSLWAEAGWIVLWAVGGALFAWYVRRPLRFVAGAGVLIAGLYGACYVLFLQGGWVPLVPPAVALVLAAGGVVLVDRFNKSDYGKAVYRQVKSFLKLDIEIDHGRVEQQVAEITETDYFNQLQQQAKALRDRKNSPKSAIAPKPPVNEDVASSTEEYLDSLQQQAQRLRSHNVEDKDA
ncbi:MAG: CHASE2 domain-containing protein [Leptolyngbyaceae cyanobacterium T60_A2020_046]|nr:CHASE2 domain-containing protein [Leptolyngbyaceae cyanobacterium T60_A2020_046]